MKAHVLIIDDDSGVRRAIRSVLQNAGYEVSTAADAEEATARFIPGQIGLVLLDLSLPQRSGWDVLEHLTSRQPTIPIIVITGLPDQYPSAVAAGVGALMEKPIEAPALLKAMDELLAEPAEARLRRLCGIQHDTRYFQQPAPRLSGDTRPSSARVRRQYRPSRPG
jgi:DNA-binding NtrC family response regulator